jgi:hypothetical protein
MGDGMGDALVWGTFQVWGRVEHWYGDGMGDEYGGRYGGRCRFHRFVLDSSRYAPWPPGGMGDVAAFIALC